jgi:hypothetical protein
LDGDHDGRTWDFTDRGEGLRNTTTLEGRRGIGQGRVHWSANFDEIQDFEQDIRNGFGGTGFMSDSNYNAGTRNTSLGDPKAGFSPELDALAAYVTSLNESPSSRGRQNNGTLTAAAQSGRLHFETLQCYTCHGSADYTDSSQAVLHDVGTLKPGSGERLGGPLTGIDTPTLRGIAYTAPYLHDGSASDMASVFNATNAPDGSPHSAFRSLTGPQQNELLNFLSQLDDSEPPVPFTPPQISSSRTGNNLNLTWPLWGLGYQLLSTTNMGVPIWTPVTNTVQNPGGYFNVTVPMTPGNRFYRLKGP